MRSRRYSHRFTFSDLSRHFDKTLTEAAAELHTSPSTLKRVCRRMGIHKWPYRQLVAIQKRRTGSASSSWVGSTSSVKETQAGNALAVEQGHLSLDFSNHKNSTSMFNFKASSISAPPSSRPQNCCFSIPATFEHSPSSYQTSPNTLPPLPPIEASLHRLVRSLQCQNAVC